MGPTERSPSPSANNLPGKLGVARMLEMLPEQHAGDHKCDNESNNDELFQKRVMMPKRPSEATPGPNPSMKTEAHTGVGSHDLGNLLELATAYQGSNGSEKIIPILGIDIPRGIDELAWPIDDNDVP